MCRQLYFLYRFLLSYYESNALIFTNTLDLNLHSPEIRLIELKIEHAGLNALVEITSNAMPVDELMLRRLKKRRLQQRDQISHLEMALIPPEPA